MDYVWLSILLISDKLIRAIDTNSPYKTGRRTLYYMMILKEREIDRWQHDHSFPYVSPFILEIF